MDPTSSELQDNVPDDLASLDEALRCEMCAERYQIAVTIGDPNCGHTFCAECILNNFKMQMEGTSRRRTCPHCRCEVKSAESSLVTNRVVQEAVIAFEKCLSKRFENDPIKKRQSPMVTPSQSAKRPCRSNRSQNLNYEENDAEDAQINSATSEVKTLPSRIFQPLRYRPPVDYNRKSPKQLKDMCKEDGISTVGAKEALAKRHQRFSLLWNAERYSISPRTPSELADLFSAREKNFERVKLFSGKEKKDSVALKNYLKSGESGDPYFDAKFGGKFGELIAQGKATMQARKAKNDAADTAGVVVSSNSISQPSHSAQEQNTQALSDHSGEAGAAFLSKTSNEVQMAKLGTVLDNHTSKEESQDDSIVTNNQGAKRLAPIDLVEEDAAIPKIAAGRPYHQSETSKGETSIVSDKSRAKRKHDSQAIALSRPKRERQPITSSWTCSKCTFYNEKHMWKSARCEMCNTQRTEL